MESSRQCGQPPGTNPEDTYKIDFDGKKIGIIPNHKLGDPGVYGSDIDFFGPDVIQSGDELPSSADEGGSAA